MNNIWFTSDTHYDHRNICRGVSKWEDGIPVQKTRDFTTLEEMNDTIVNGINKYIKEDDELWHLGDFSFNGIENIWNFRKRIKCKNIHLILGNHDHHIEKNKILPNVHVDYKTDEITDGKNPLIYGDGRDNLFGVEAKNLFKSIQHVYFGKIGGKTMFLSHYAHRVWDKSHKGVIHLYGHSHSTLEYQEWGKSMDVGIDNAYRLFGEYRPFSLEEIVKIMKERETKIIDHHNFFTT